MSGAAWLLLALAVPAQDPAAVLQDARAEPLARSSALCALQDQGALTVELLVGALAQQDDPTLQQTAVAVLRHEWRQWPPELIAALGREPAAVACVLDELATAPRPAADHWVAARALSTAEPGLQFAAMAARTQPPDRAEAAAALRALEGDHAGAAALCLQRLDAAVADQLVGVAHELLLKGLQAERLQPWFERLSDHGARQLLGLAVLLDPRTAIALCQQLAARDDPRYWERVRAALDGEIPLEAHWLQWSGKLLTTRERIARVAAVVVDPDAKEQLRQLAFDALLDAGAVSADALPFAQAGGPERMRRLLRTSRQELPDAVWLAALEGDLQRQGLAADALAQRRFSLPVERRVLALLDVFDLGAMDATNGLAWKFALALLQGGSDVGVRAALAKVGSDASLQSSAYEALGCRRDPIAAAALRADLGEGAAAGADAAELLRIDHLRLLLAEAGDRLQLEALVAGAGTRSAAFVRRCRHALPDLPAPLARQLAAAVDKTADDGVRVELVLWLGRARDGEVRAALQRWWQQADDEELREAALRGLMQGKERAALLADWQAGPPSGEPWELIAYEAIASMPDRLGQDDIALLQHLLFEAPRRDAVRERARAERFPDGRTGFPLVAAIADRLRRDPGAGAAVCAPASALVQEHRLDGLVRQRFLFLWTALQALPELRQQVGAATAALVLAIPDPRDAGAGAANLYLADALAAQGDHDGAAAASRKAARILLRDPRERANARIHLGARDPLAGIDPWSALAARPDLEAARAALGRGDFDAAAAAAANAAEFAGRDTATHAAIAAILTQSRR